MLDVTLPKPRKKRFNIAQYVVQLQAANIAFQTFHKGLRIEIPLPDGIIDLWPSTGLWWVRGQGHKKRNFQSLLSHCKARQ